MKLKKQFHFDYLNEIFYYDETSPSCLRWKISPNTKTPRTEGDPVGIINNNSWCVYYDKQKFRINKIVWILCKKEDSFSSFRLYHVNKNPLDNRISNLSTTKSTGFPSEINNPDSSIFCVYTHSVKDTIIYVGSGTISRPYSKDGRTKEHLVLFDKLTVEIVKDNLSRNEAITLEHYLYEVNKSTIINKVKPSIVKPIVYELISRFVKYDENSPTGLVWIVDGFSGRGRKMHSKGDIAGSISNGKYSNVHIDGKQYLSHRVVWCLTSGADFESNSVVDHIDRDKTNNKIENLRLTSWTENSFNKRLSKHNNTGVSGVYWCKTNLVWIVINKLSGTVKTKTFNPKRLFPNLEFNIARDSAFLVACEYRKEFLESIGST